MLVIVLCLFLLYFITLCQKSIKVQEGDMEDLYQEIHKLHREMELAENMKQEMRDVIKYLEVEKVELGELATFTKKKHELKVSQMTEKNNELKVNIQELEEVILSLKKADIEDTEEECISTIASNLEELEELKVKKQEAENAFSELQKAKEEFQARNTQLVKEREQLLMQFSELQSELSLKMERYNASKEEMKTLQEENALRKVEIETLKAKVNTHSSKGNSVFSEVEDCRQKLEKQIKKQKVQLASLQKRHYETSLMLRKLMKENIRLSEELAQTKEQVSIEEFRLQLVAHKERLKDLETAEQVWEEEKAAVPIVLCNDYKSVKMFDTLVEKEREKTKQFWARYEEIMMRYISMTDEAVALKNEFAVMERMKLRAEAEIVKLGQEIEKKRGGDHKDDDLIPAVETLPLEEIQKEKKCRFAPETIEPSTRKLVAKKETIKIPYLTSS